MNRKKLPVKQNLQKFSSAAKRKERRRTPSTFWTGTERVGRELGGAPNTYLKHCDKTLMLGFGTTIIRKTGETDST